jgi:hypothetical protein
MNQIFIKLIILNILLLGIIACGSFEHKNKIKWSELTNLSQEEYFGGFSQKNIFIANRLIDSLAIDESNKNCKNKSEQINLIDEELPNPVNFLSNDDHLYKLNLLIQSDNQLVRDISLYIVSKLGPSASELLSHLKYYQSKDYYFSIWMHSAIENISCQKWIFTRFNQSYKSKLLKSEIINKLERMITKELFFPKNEIHSFVSSHLGEMDSSIEAIDLLKYLKSPDIKESIKAEILSALSIEEIIDLKVNLDDFKGYIKDVNFGRHIKYLFFESSHPLGIEIIKMELEQNNLDSIEFLCNYKNKAKKLDVLLIKRLKDSKNKAEIRSIIKSLGCIESESSIDYLIPHLKNQDWEFQVYVIEAINRINPVNPKAKEALKLLMDKTWSSFIRTYIRNKYVHEKRKCKPNELCYDTSPFSMDPTSSPKDHGMTTCSDNAQFSYDNINWFHVNWQGSDNSELPKNFPTYWKSEYYEHSILKVKNGWVFGSDYGHNDGYLTYWSGSISTSYIIKDWTDVFKVLNHKGEIYALGYSFLDNTFSGHLYKIIKNNQNRWEANIVLYLPGHPDKYGFDPNGELLVADSMNHYSVRKNEITPLFCREK